MAYLRDPVIHDLRNVQFCERLGRYSKRLRKPRTSRLTDALPQVARDGVRVQVSLEVQRDTLEELVLADEF